MKKNSKLEKKLALSSEKLRDLSASLTDKQLGAVAGAQMGSNGCPGCDCSSAWC